MHFSGACYLAVAGEVLAEAAGVAEAVAEAASVVLAEVVLVVAAAAAAGNLCFDGNIKMEKAFIKIPGEGEMGYAQGRYL
ncbi:hypothetical protein D3C87_2037390 [compost metagenome]